MGKDYWKLHHRDVRFQFCKCSKLCSGFGFELHFLSFGATNLCYIRHGSFVPVSLSLSNAGNCMSGKEEMMRGETMGHGREHALHMESSMAPPVKKQIRWKMIGKTPAWNSENLVLVLVDNMGLDTQ